MKKKVGVILAGGGARGAYEAGVLRGISKMGNFKTSPFAIITGVSAGAINGMGLAEGAEDFDKATEKLWNTWENIRVEDVFKTDSLSLLKTGTNWMVNLSCGQWLGGRGNITHLLDTSPLNDFLSARVDPKAIARNIRDGYVKGVSLSATDYYTGKLVTFFDGEESIKPWSEPTSVGVRTKLTVRHIMASAAIPIFFPPIRIGDEEYGDGGIGLRSPLSDAIHLGAEEILVIGLQYTPKEKPVTQEKRGPITLANIAGVLLSSLFMNSLDSDLGRLESTNLALSKLSKKERELEKNYMREIPALVVQPSSNLGSIDTEHFERLPYTLKYLLKGLGMSQQKGWELLSYLAFEKGYASALLQLGYQDAMSSKEKILAMFEG
jgi:NTE family protein